MSPELLPLVSFDHFPVFHVSQRGQAARLLLYISSHPLPEQGIFDQIVLYMVRFTKVSIVWDGKGDTGVVNPRQRTTPRKRTFKKNPPRPIKPEIKTKISLSNGYHSVKRFGSISTLAKRFVTPTTVPNTANIKATHSFQQNKIKPCRVM